MTHLEKLVRQYYEWQGYLIRGNVKVGRLAHGGWAGELDIVAYPPQENRLLHLEPSIDADSWKRREERFEKKFTLGRKHIYAEVFPWVSGETPLEQIAILITGTRQELAGGRAISIDEFLRTVKEEVRGMGRMMQNAIPEEYDLLHTIQMTICGYQRVLGPSL